MAVLDYLHKAKFLVTSETVFLSPKRQESLSYA